MACMAYVDLNPIRAAMARTRKALTIPASNSALKRHNSNSGDSILISQLKGSVTTVYDFNSHLSPTPFIFLSLLGFIYIFPMILLVYLKIYMAHVHRHNVFH